MGKEKWMGAAVELATALGDALVDKDATEKEILHLVAAGVNVLLLEAVERMVENQSNAS
jgi:hypothetical protein